MGIRQLSVGEVNEEPRNIFKSPWTTRIEGFLSPTIFPMLRVSTDAMYLFGVVVNICLLIIPLAVTIGTLAGIDAHRKSLGEGSLFAQSSYRKRAFTNQVSRNSTSVVDDLQLLQRPKEDFQGKALF